MQSFIEFLNERSYKTKETKTFTVTASPEVMNNLERFLAYCQHCSQIGHSATIAFPIDGDGADSIRVSNIEKWDMGSRQVPHKNMQVEWIGFIED